MAYACIEDEILRDQASEAFLQKHLLPTLTDYLSLGDGCLHGTRKNLLAEVETWRNVKALSSNTANTASSGDTPSSREIAGASDTVEHTLPSDTASSTETAVFDTLAVPGDKTLSGDTISRNVLWISGDPGVGKSTISTTLVKKTFNYDCAYVFVKSNSVTSDPRRIWRSIAFGLAKAHRGLKVEIMEVLNANPHIVDADIAKQFSLLIKGPLLKLNCDPRLPIVLVDALDECARGDFSQKERWTELLDTIRSWCQLPPTCKLIVTSRDWVDIEKELHDASHRIRLQAGDRVSDESSQDIHVFFEKKFKKMTWRLAPDEDEIGKLTAHAAGLFIWAMTVVTFVGDPAVRPSDNRLAEVMRNMGHFSENETKMDSLYRQILDSAFSNLQKKERNRREFVLGAIALAKETLRYRDVVDLLTSVERCTPGPGQNENEIRDDVDSSLYSLTPVIANTTSESSSAKITLRDNNPVLAFRHKTFSEFLPEWKRIQDEVKCETYILQRSEQSARLTMACLLLMKKELHFNICELPSSHYPNDKVPNINKLVADHIPSSLAYACLHWTDHLIDVDKESPHMRDIMQLLNEFLNEHTLHWLEVLSLTKSVARASTSLDAIKRYTKVRTFVFSLSGLVDLLGDMLCSDLGSFLVKFRARRQQICHNLPTSHHRERSPYLHISTPLYLIKLIDR